MKIKEKIAENSEVLIFVSLLIALMISLGLIVSNDREVCPQDLCSLSPYSESFLCYGNNTLTQSQKEHFEKYQGNNDWGFCPDLDNLI